MRLAPRIKPSHRQRLYEVREEHVSGAPVTDPVQRYQNAPHPTEVPRTPRRYPTEVKSPRLSFSLSEQERKGRGGWMERSRGRELRGRGAGRARRARIAPGRPGHTPTFGSTDLSLAPVPC